MVFTAASRAANLANDPSFSIKFWTRVVLSIILIIPLGLLLYVASYSSNFKSPAFSRDTSTVACVPFIFITLVWIAVNIAVLTKFSRPLNPFFNLIAHGSLTFIFLVVGAVAAHYTAQANSIINRSPYLPASWSDKGDSKLPRKITADNGTTITLDGRNWSKCPAFLTCADQREWMEEIKHRNSVAAAGVAIFFICMTAQLLLTLCFWQDCKLRREKQRQEEALENSFNTNTSQLFPPSTKHAYRDLPDEHTSHTSQETLLRDKPSFYGTSKTATDSVISVFPEQERPGTASSIMTKKPLFNRPKSNGPGLPLMTLSRSNSIASTIMSRKSTKRKKGAKKDKDLPPVPMIKPEQNMSKTSLKSNGSIDSKSKKLLVFPPTRPITPVEAALPTIKVPKMPLNPLPPLDPVQSLSPLKKSFTADSPKYFSDDRTLSSDPPRSPNTDIQSSRGGYDYQDDLLTALPAGAPKPSFQSSRSSIMTGVGDLEGLRYLRGALFKGGAGATSDGTRSSMASSGRLSPFGPRTASPFGDPTSGRTSPWRERIARREEEKALREEREEREQALLDAQSRAHRAAEKMESHYLREEMGRQDEKEAMRRQQADNRVQRLKDTLEDLKRIQDLEEEMAREKAERDRLERESESGDGGDLDDEELQRDITRMFSHKRAGSAVSMKPKIVEIRNKPKESRLQTEVKRDDVAMPAMPAPLQVGTPAQRNVNGAGQDGRYS